MASAASRDRVLYASGKVGVITINFLPFHKMCQRENITKDVVGKCHRLSWGSIREDGEMCG